MNSILSGPISGRVFLDRFRSFCFYYVSYLNSNTDDHFSHYIVSFYCIEVESHQQRPLIHSDVAFASNFSISHILGFLRQRIHLHVFVGVDVWWSDGGHPLLQGGAYLQKICSL